MESFIIVAKIIAALLICFHEVHCHGRLKTPASRSSMWRYGFSNPTNYNDNQLFCGGKYRQFVVNRGQCGVCGDPYDGARENEALGRFANGVIAGTYNEGDVMPVTVEITANLLGWFEFRLCPVNNKKIRATQQCLDRYLLKESSTGRTRFPIGKRTGLITTSVELPTGLTCTQCVLQWKYHAGNNPGTDEQEQFYGCADIAIESRGEGGNKPSNTSPMDIQNNNNIPNGDVTVCRSAGAYRGQAILDSWCEDNCNMGNCPPSHCKCVTVNLQENERLDRENPKQASVSTSKRKFRSSSVSNLVSLVEFFLSLND